ncbi:MAG: tyrosine-type recombinase/integrase [Chloroflexi bacterium]|nr:tyrosine-type recombinase/integrase [Chloroflexota bacterium]
MADENGHRHIILEPRRAVRQITRCPLPRPSVTHRFQRVLADAGIPRHRFHDLRHTCATLLLAQGVALRVVMETLGHSQMSTTADIYAHVLPVLMADAVDKMDAALA